ncbi:ATP-dependent DNA helicase RecQ-like [Saccoglossus kowalevskii]
MVKRCVVYGCNATHKDGVSLHNFPKSGRFRRRWVRTKRADWNRVDPGESAVVCAKHFTTDCFQDSSLKTSLGFSTYYSEEVWNKYGFEYQLKPQQTRIINSVVEKQNIIGILPTGFGKSDTFIIPPLLLDQMYPLKKHISLVISPLRSLMFNQQRILKERGIDVGCIMRRDEMLDADKQKILNGQCSIVFTSPESIMMEPWRGDVKKCSL